MKKLTWSLLLSAALLLVPACSVDDTQPDAGADLGMLAPDLAETPDAAVQTDMATDGPVSDMVKSGDMNVPPDGGVAMKVFTWNQMLSWWIVNGGTNTCPTSMQAMTASGRFCMANGFVGGSPSVPDTTCQIGAGPKNPTYKFVLCTN